MTIPLADNLLSIAQSFSISKIASPHPHTFQLQLVSPLDAADRTIVETVVETVIKTANVDISWLNKDVRFNTSPIADDDPIGGQPILNILTPGLTLTEQNPTTPPGVAGVIAALKATIPIPVLENVTKALSLTIEIQWSVLDQNGNPVADVQWTIGGTSGNGGSIPLQAGQALTPLALTFTPQIVELVDGMELTVTRTIKASIRITARDTNGAFRASTGWVDLPPIPVILPVVPVPTIALFFADQYGGDTLIAVPLNSPIKDESTLVPALDALNSVLGLLDGALGVGGFFLQTLGDIKHVLANNVGKKKFLQADACADLRTVRFSGWTITNWNGEDGDDHFESMMLLGAPNRSVECFNARQFNTGEGKLIVWTGMGLHTQVAALAATPVSDPPNQVAVPHAASGWWIDDFNDEISSYRFGWV